MKNKNHIGFIALLFLCSCSYSASEGENRTNNNPSDHSSFQEKSINGVYLYSDNSAKSTITVSGSIWSGKLIIISGFGDSYDNSNAIYSNGIVKNGILYDDSGYFELGYINETSLTMPIGSNRVTHYK